MSFSSFGLLPQAIPFYRRLVSSVCPMSASFTLRFGTYFLLSHDIVPSPLNLSKPYTSTKQSLMTLEGLHNPFILL
jgi:hypothetical protein